MLKLGPVNKAFRNLDTTNNKKRKTTTEIPTFISAAKRARVNELSSPSTPRRIEKRSQQNNIPQSTHRKGNPNLVEEGAPKETARPTNLVQTGMVEEEEAANEEEADDSDTAEAQAHALIQEIYRRNVENSSASEPHIDAYREDRNDSALDMDDDDPDRPLMSRLFYQFAQLKEIVVSVLSLQAHVDELNIQRPTKSPFKDFDTLRRKIRTSYKALLDPPTEEDAIAAQRTIRSCITKLQRLVKDLDFDAAAVRKPQGLLKNIYAFIFVDILKVLATASYSILQRTESDNEIVSSNLSELIDITRCITSLGSRASKCKTKTDLGLNLARSVKNDIVAPLKRVLRKFERHRNRLEAEEEETEKKIHRSQEVRRLWAERELEKELTAMLASKWDRLRNLYMWRANVEIDLNRRLGRLAMPNLRRRDTAYPLDANGHPFEREAVFKPRSSIPHMDRPSAADEDEDWTEEELEALQDGLAKIPRKFVGLCSLPPSLIAKFVQSDNDLFWKKFYKEYCHYRRNDDGSRGGPLRDRTVAEILKEMVRFRDYAIEDEADLPEWLRDVPDMDLVPLL